ncbi:hypothetical protein V8C86DRAFT_736547 [Haematococcus lacustris]
MPGTASAQTAKTPSRLRQDQGPAPGLCPPGPAVPCYGAACHPLHPSAASMVPLQAQPGGAVLRVLLRETYRHMYDLTPQGLCGVTHGLVGLGVVLPQQWVRKLLDAAWQRMRVRAQGPLPPPSTQPPAAGDPHRQQQHQQGWQSSGATATISTGEERRAGGGEKARGEAGAGGGSGAWPAMSGGFLQPSLPQPLAAAAAAPPGPLALPGSPPSPQLSEAQQVLGRRGGPGYAGRLAARDCLDVTSLVRLLWALVKASHAPPRAWLAGCLVQVEAEVGELTAADVAQLMWCLAQMQVRPSLPLLAQLMARGYATLQELPPEGLVALVWALGQLGARPSAVWAERALKSVYRLAPSMGCWGCCSLLWSLGLLQLRPSLKLVTALLAAARQQLEEAASRGEGGPGTSLVGGAGAGSSGVQASRAKQAGRPSRSSAGPDDLYQLSTGLVALKHTTGLPAWLAPALSSLAGQQLHRLPLQQQEQVRVALQQLGVVSSS